MKKLNQIRGYIEIEDCKYPFHFYTSDFILRIYPPTIEKWHNDMFSIFEKMESNKKRNEWIGSRKLFGITSENYRICLCVLDSPSSYGGFKEYNVQWIIYYNEKANIDSIKGMRISGGDINRFFPAESALALQINRNEDLIIREMTVSSKNMDYLPCGKYRVVKGIDANIEVKAFATADINNYEKPIYADSTIRINYSAPTSIDIIIKTFDEIQKFFIYSLYRTNIVFKDIELFWEEDDGKRYYNGRLLVNFKLQYEEHKKAGERLIGYSFWNKNIGRMLTVIKNGKLSFNHVCKNIEDRSHYPTSRTILIFTEFEREFRNIYGANFNRGDEFKKEKQAAVDLLMEEANKYTGKKRKIYKSFSKTIKAIDESYSTKVEFALMDCKDVMEVFVRNKYSNNYEENVENISMRVGELRNGFAHSKLDTKLEPIHLSDIKVIEELTYAIRLKKLNKNTKSVQKALNALFGENIGMG